MTSSAGTAFRSRSTGAEQVKTTVEISDALLGEANKSAAREGITVRTLIEQGLRHELAARTKRGSFKLRKASFKGRGLSAGARSASWQQLRELAYEACGGAISGVSPR
jgi:hypothetical protein